MSTTEQFLFKMSLERFIKETRDRPAFKGQAAALRTLKRIEGLAALRK